MLEREFEQYLLQRFPGDGKEGSRASTLSRCRRIERHEGSLDGHYDGDKMRGLIGRLEYSKEDESCNRPPRHSIPIKGKKKSSIREGTSSLKDAAKTYLDFRNGILPQDQNKSARSTASATRPNPSAALSWPKWERPGNDDVMALLAATAKHIRFLSPSAIAAIVQDNLLHASRWRLALDRNGIDSSIYLWDGSACAFPGIRRYSGRVEIRDFGNRDFSNLSDALATDDNTYPKQIWAFLFTGKKFANYGPSGYRLAHLIDHKGGTRFREEVRCDIGGAYSVPGLYTAASNSAYICEELIDPTDFNAMARRVIQQRAYNLYRDVCELLPPGYSLQPDPEAEALAKELPWADPVNGPGTIEAFLEWRGYEIKRLIEKKEMGGVLS